MTDVLPAWDDGTVAVLSTIGGGGAHAIPVSTALRAGPLRIVFALSRARGSLQRLRDDPRVALTLLGAGNVAITAHGTAAIVTESLPGGDGVAAIALSVDRISDHASGDSEVLAGVRWTWLDAAAGARDAQIMRALRALAIPATLVVLDVQNGFVNDRTRCALPLVVRLIEHWQAKRWPVVFTRFHNPEGSAYERWIDWTGLRSDDEIALHECVRRHAHNVVDKSIYTAFTTEGDEVLAVHAGDTLVICGMDTESCVLKTALDAFERDVEPVIAIDACASDGGEAAQQAARLVLERCVGAGRVLATADVLARFASDAITA